MGCNSVGLTAEREHLHPIIIVCFFCFFKKKLFSLTRDWLIFIGRKLECSPVFFNVRFQQLRARALPAERCEPAGSGESARRMAQHLKTCAPGALLSPQPDCLSNTRDLAGTRLRVCGVCLYMRVKLGGLPAVTAEDWAAGGETSPPVGPAGPDLQRWSFSKIRA